MNNWVNKSLDDAELRDWVKSQDSFTCYLDELAQKYNCDKANSQVVSKLNRNAPSDWPDDKKLKIVGHNYVEVYDKFFSTKREESLNILEIGMGNYPTNGFSLRMWLEYFPNSKITILDNNPSNFNCDFNFDKDRVNFITFDQSIESDIKRVAEQFSEGYFDVIIDDGSHIAKHQFETFIHFFKILKNDCMYFIEDLHDKNFTEYMVDLFKHLNSGMLCESTQYDSNLDIGSIFLHRSLVCISKSKKITR
jgi:hypothetical protein